MIKQLITAAALVLTGSTATASEQPMTVEQLFTLVENNVNLTAARTGVEAASAGIEAARAAWLPDVNAKLSLSYNGNGLLMSREFDEAQWVHIPHLGNSLSLEVQQVIYSGGAIPAGIKLAELGKSQAETAIQLTREQQRFLALGQYLDILKLNNGIKVYEQNIALTERLIADITLKYEQGMVLRNDITRYELQLENLKLGLTRLIDKRSILNHQLCNALNLPDGTQVVPDASLTHLQPAGHSQDEWQLLASTTSPVMQQQEIGVKMAEQRERLARSEMRPKVAFFAADNFNGPITFEIPPINKNINVWYLGVGVTYNIGALYKSNKKVKQAQLNTRQTMERKDVAAQNLNNSVQAAYTQLQQNYVELATQQKSVQLAQQNYDVVNERYLNQMALITDMVDASNIKLNAELQEVDARINILLAHYKMQYLAGTL